MYEPTDINPADITTSLLSPNPVFSCELWWIKHEQLFLRRETNFTKMKHSLSLFFDEENLLRCRTRISSDETLNYGIRFPALLQRSSNFTKLIILHHHDKVYHCGVEATLNHIRNFHWIVIGRKTVISMLRSLFRKYVVQNKMQKCYIIVYL